MNVGVGDYGFRQMTGDVSGPLSSDGKLRFRLIANHEETPNWRDGRPDETPRHAVSPIVAWDYADTGSVLLRYERNVIENDPEDRGII